MKKSSLSKNQLCTKYYEGMIGVTGEKKAELVRGRSSLLTERQIIGKQYV